MTSRYAFKSASAAATLVLAFSLAQGCGGSSTCHDVGYCPGEEPGGTSGSSGSNGNAGESTAGTSGANGGKGGAASAGSSSGGKSGMSGTSGTSSAGEGGAAGTGGGGCDTTKSPTEESCLVADDYAVFVAPNGNDADNDGSRAAPLASLTKAIEVADGAKLVLVCDATYNEHVVVAAGVHVYGGFKCTDWSAENAKPLFKPATAGPALKIDGVDDEVVIEGVSFEVGDAVAAGETALTAIVNQSPKITLRNVLLKAGKGKSGVNGTLSQFDFPDASTLNGNAENSPDKGGEKMCTCQTGKATIGGVGGTPSSTGQAGAKGGPSHGSSGGEGGDPAAGDCGNGSSGKKGANAPSAPPANGASTLGIAAATGWQPASGIDGATGAPGQGGGGGASFNIVGHGGGGGCGGCGGNGGTAGKGGGGSIALLALGSPVTIENSSLVTADAGNAGNGASGQPGQGEFGGGGGTVSTANSCAGGAGGKGGDGGAGGGGAGGISVGIVWSGAKAPTVSADTTITNGKAGLKGIGGVPGTNDGLAGVSQKILPLN